MQPAASLIEVHGVRTRSRPSLPSDKVHDEYLSTAEKGENEAQSLV